MAVGVKEANRRGFGEGHPDATPLLNRRRQAEELTSQLQAAGFDVLSAGERAEFAGLVQTLKDALDANK